MCRVETIWDIVAVEHLCRSGKFYLAVLQWVMAKPWVWPECGQADLEYAEIFRRDTEEDSSTQLGQKKKKKMEFTSIHLEGISWLAHLEAEVSQSLDILAEAMAETTSRSGMYVCMYVCIHVFMYLFFFMAVPAAYWNSQARGRIGAAAAGLHHSHSNAKAELHLWPVLQLAAMLHL